MLKKNNSKQRFNKSISNSMEETKSIDTDNPISIYYELDCNVVKSVSILTITLGILIIIGHVVKFAMTFKLHPYNGLTSALVFLITGTIGYLNLKNDKVYRGIFTYSALTILMCYIGLLYTMYILFNVDDEKSSTACFIYGGEIILSIFVELSFISYLINFSFKKISIHNFMSVVLKDENNIKNVNHADNKNKINEFQSNIITSATTNSTQLPSSYTSSKNGTTVSNSSFK
uniref:MARVEL domain-containing protein n=1 Tax=Strongyloides stercoralis TaxID=6248 RepID=A0A0K0DSJ0_STRER